MFKGLINDVKSAAGSIVGKYLARASVGVPFLIACGFATAAGTHMLVERFGPVVAYGALAGGFLLLGLVAMLVVREKEHEEAGDKVAATGDTSGVASDAVAQAAGQAPLALLAALFSTPFGPTALAGGAKVAARNLPLVVMLGLIAVLFWPKSSSDMAGELDGADERWRGSMFVRRTAIVCRQFNHEVPEEPYRPCWRL